MDDDAMYNTFWSLRNPDQGKDDQENNRLLLWL